VQFSDSTLLFIVSTLFANVRPGDTTLHEAKPAQERFLLLPVHVEYDLATLGFVLEVLRT
jgi:hypothetical protein